MRKNMKLIVSMRGVPGKNIHDCKHDFNVSFSKKFATFDKIATIVHKKI